MGFLSTLFNKQRNAETPVPETSIVDWGNEPLTDAMLPADLAVAMALINDAALQTVVAHGLPAHWFSFETVTVKDSEKTYFQLQILMNHWDMQMCAHTYALECAVVKYIRKKNSGVGHALRAVLWRIAPDAGCPFDQMPAPSYWNPQAIAQRDLLRQRIQREFYAITTPESGAKITHPAALEDPVALEGRAPIQENLDFSDTFPRNLSGFSLTHPHAKPSASKPANSKNH